MIKAIKNRFPLRATTGVFSLALFAAAMGLSPSASANTIKSSHPPGWTKGIDFASLPLEKAIVRVRGTGENKVALIVDPSCPYSREQEQELESVDNVTIYTFVENVLNQPLGREFTQLVQCQDGNDAQAAAWENWILKGKRPPQVAACRTTSIKADLGNLQSPLGRFYANLSPVMVFESGITGESVVRTAEIEEVFTVTFD